MSIFSNACRCIVVYHYADSCDVDTCESMFVVKHILFLIKVSSSEDNITCASSIVSHCSRKQTNKRKPMEHAAPVWVMIGIDSGTHWSAHLVSSVIDMTLVAHSVWLHCTTHENHLHTAQTPATYRSVGKLARAAAKLQVTHSSPSNCSTDYLSRRHAYLTLLGLWWLSFANAVVFLLWWKLVSAGQTWNAVQGSRQRVQGEARTWAARWSHHVEIMLSTLEFVHSVSTQQTQWQQTKENFIFLSEVILNAFLGITILRQKSTAADLIKCCVLINENIELLIESAAQYISYNCNC